jgi:propionyl-CoA synthetase
MTYSEIYQAALQDPERFWRNAAEEISWDQPFTQVFRDGRWFADGLLNTCYNCIDRHVETERADQAALIYDSPVTGVKETLTYRRLQERVSRFAGALRHLGVEKGDRVLIYMPMVPEALIAMYACARLGAIHSVVFGGFASHELAIRIDDARPKVVVTASCGIEITRVVEYKPLLDKAIQMSCHKPSHCVVLQRSQQICDLVENRDITWQDSLVPARETECVPVLSTDPLYILYTSGTTGKPKGVVRDNGGHAVALKWSMKNIYGIEPGEVFWAASDIGWAVGHSYIAYGPLLHGCTSIIHEGKPVKTPDAGNFWRLISEHSVAALFTAPTAIRAIKQVDPQGEFLKPYDLSCMRTLFLAGERLDPDTYYWARDLLKCPVIDHWWQTETGWPVAANPVGIEMLSVKPGSSTKAVPGYQIEILDEHGLSLPAGQEGSVVLKCPLPPGCFPTLWQDKERYQKLYFERYPGYYFTGDGGHLDQDGYLSIMGRIDDVIIVSGHNLSTGSIEEVVAAHPAVAECAVFGVRDPLRTQVPIGMVVLKSGVLTDHSTISSEIITAVRDQVGPVANFKQVIVVNRLPKTRSGKILRSALRKLADGVDFQTPSTIDDPTVLVEVRTDLKRFGYPSDSGNSR